MVSLARSGARFLAENQGQNRDAGTERTSATASAPAARRRGEAFGGKIGMPDAKQIEADHY